MLTHDYDISFSMGNSAMPMTSCIQIEICMEINVTSKFHI